jgi:predicted amidophosphoribosyltransferase
MPPVAAPTSPGPTRLLRLLALSLTRCPGCSSRPATASGCCDACWRTMHAPLRTPDVLAVGRYRGALGAVLRSAKFGGASLALDTLGTSLGVLLRDAGVGHLGVVPVPSHAARRRRRGPDPSSRLAQRAAAGRVLDVLRRHRHDRPQSRSPLRDRERNAAGAFALEPDAAHLVRGRSVVLLDDVLTSGATARACAAALATVDARVAVVAVAALS